MALTADDHRFLTRAVDLAEEALRAGDEPFGTILVAPDGTIVFEDRNRVSNGDQTQHPEFAVARWAGQHLPQEARAAHTVYTSGEHCPMCAAAHGWVGLGRIVYATSAAQFSQWMTDQGHDAGPVASLPIGTVVPGATVDGPDPDLIDRVRDLHLRRAGRSTP